MANMLKRSMVYLGLAEDGTQEEEAIVETPVRPSKAEREEAHAPVTPLRRPAVVRQPAAHPMSEILTVHPKAYNEAPMIAEAFRDGVPVIINLSQMSDGDARRMIDFASGLALGLYGGIERVTSKVFLLSPENITVAGGGGVARADDAPFVK